MEFVIVKDTFLAEREFVVKLNDGETFVDAARKVKDNELDAEEIENSIAPSRDANHVYTMRTYRDADTRDLMVQRAERRICNPDTMDEELGKEENKGKRHRRTKAEMAATRKAEVSQAEAAEILRLSQE